MKYLERCHDGCRMYLVECASNSPHYGALRCKEHGFIKWLSESLYDELHPVMYPPYNGHRASELLF